MKGKKKRMIAAIAVIALLAAGGVAFTTAISAFPANDTNTAAFAQTHITGATNAGVVYNLSSDGQFVQSADVYFTTDESGNNVDAGFGTTSINAQLISCVNSGTAVVGGTYDGDYDSHCDFAGSTTYTPHGVPVGTGTAANYFAVSVTDKLNGANKITGVTPVP
jgi:hypothetical protein